MVKERLQDLRHIIGRYADVNGDIQCVDVRCQFGVTAGDFISRLLVGHVRCPRFAENNVKIPFPGHLPDIFQSGIGAAFH